MRHESVPGRAFSAANHPGDDYGSTGEGAAVVVVDAVGVVVGGDEVDVGGAPVVAGEVSGSEQAAATAAAPSAAVREMNCRRSSLIRATTPTV